MRLSPVNISVHTVNDELRCKMLGNPDSGGIVAKIRRLTAQNITVNAQIVLCKNYNDGAGLINSIKVLHAAGVNSLSVVPVGLTKYRDGLPPLEPFSKEDCKNIIKIIEKLSKVFYEKYGTRFVYPADEFFIKGEVPIPRAAYYDGFGQIENGVGLLASLTKEFNLSLTRRKTGGFGEIPPVTVGVSVAAHDTVKSLIDKFNQKFNSQIGVIKIETVFFGSDITVAGLLTGQDIIGGLKGKNIEKVLLPRTILRSDGDLTLDGMTVADIERNICARVEICDVDGKMLIDMLLGLE
jgi:putative radical SAM enzyme (TIGR03279 family)